MMRQNYRVSQHGARGMRVRSPCLCNENSDMMCEVQRIEKPINARSGENHMQKFLVLCCSAILLSASVLAPRSSGQQDKSQRPSPPAQAQFSFADGKTVTVDYSSPRAKGRKIFGELVPYGQVWRAGANEATTFVTDTAVTVGGKTVPAGSYTLFTIPNQGGWTLIISKKTGEWGIPYPGEKFDFVRTEMTPSKLASPIENFSIGFVTSRAGCRLSMAWENTQASVQIARK